MVFVALPKCVLYSIQSMKVLHFSLNKLVHIPHTFSLHSELSFANVSKHWNSINSFLYISCGAYLKKQKVQAIYSKTVESPLALKGWSWTHTERCPIKLSLLDLTSCSLDIFGCPAWCNLGYWGLHHDVTSPQWRLLRAPLVTLSLLHLLWLRSLRFCWTFTRTSKTSWMALLKQWKL